MRDTERERQRHRQREKQAPCREPHVGLDPGSPGSGLRLKAALNRWATQPAHNLCILRSTDEWPKLHVQNLSWGVKETDSQSQGSGSGIFWWRVEVGHDSACLLVVLELDLGSRQYLAQSPDEPPCFLLGDQGQSQPCQASSLSGKCQWSWLVLSQGPSTLLAKAHVRIGLEYFIRTVIINAWSAF